MVLLLQGIAHHCFVMPVGHSKKRLKRGKLYSIEFGTGSKMKTMSNRFWMGARLIDVEISPIPSNVPVVKG